MDTRHTEADKLDKLSTNLLNQFEAYIGTKKPKKQVQADSGKAQDKEIPERKPWFHFHDFEEERALFAGDALDPTKVGEWVDQVVAYDNKPWYEKFIGLFTGESQAIAGQRRVLVATQVHELARARRSIFSAGARLLDAAGNRYHRHLSRAIDAPVASAAGDAPSVPTIEDGFSRPGWKLSEQVSRLGFFDRLGWIARSFLNLVTGNVTIEGDAVQKAVLIKEGAVSAQLVSEESYETGSELGRNFFEAKDGESVENALRSKFKRAGEESARAIEAKGRELEAAKRNHRKKAEERDTAKQAEAVARERLNEAMRDRGYTDPAAVGVVALSGASATVTPMRDYAEHSSAVVRGTEESKDTDESKAAELDLYPYS